MAEFPDVNVGNSARINGAKATTAVKTVTLPTIGRATTDIATGPFVMEAAGILEGIKGAKVTFAGTCKEMEAVLGIEGTTFKFNVANKRQGSNAKGTHFQCTGMATKDESQYTTNESADTSYTIKEIIYAKGTYEGVVFEFNYATDQVLVNGTNIYQDVLAVLNQ